MGTWAAASRLLEYNNMDTIEILEDRVLVLRKQFEEFVLKNRTVKDDVTLVSNTEYVLDQIDYLLNSIRNKK